MSTHDFEHHFADLGEVTIHYVTAGAGLGDMPPLVLVHGWPETWYEWRHVMPRLAAHHPVITLDMRGLGDSSRPLEGYDKRTVAHDVFRLLTGHLGLDRWHCVGHDWGGPVTFALGAWHPEPMITMTIIDVVIPGDGGDFSQGGRRWHHAFHLTPICPRRSSPAENARISAGSIGSSHGAAAPSMHRPPTNTCARTPSRAHCARDSRTTATSRVTRPTTGRCSRRDSGCPCRCWPWAARRPRLAGARPSPRSR